MADTQETRDQIVAALRDGLAFLERQSLLYAREDLTRKRFTVEERQKANGDIVFDTSLGKERMQGSQRLTVTEAGEILTSLHLDNKNPAPASASVVAMPFPSALVHFINAKEKMLQGGAKPALHKTDKTASAMLTDIAKSAALDGMVSLAFRGTAATPAQEAVQAGLDMAAWERGFAADAAAELRDSFDFLARLSDGKLHVIVSEIKNTSDISIRINTDADMLANAVVRADGMIKFSYKPTCSGLILDYGSRKGVDLAMVLTETAKSLALAGQVTLPDPPPEAGSLAQQTVLNTVRAVTQEIEDAEKKARLLTEGIAFLAEQSEGALSWSQWREPGRSSLKFKIESPLVTREISDRADDKFLVYTDAPGFNEPPVKEEIIDSDFAGDAFNIYDSSSKETDAAALLREMARSAVFEGLIPSAEKAEAADFMLSALFAEEASPVPDNERDNLHAGENIVLDAIRQAAEEKAQVSMAAEPLRAELKTLQEQFGGYFDFADITHPQEGHAIFTINPADSEPTVMTVPADGRIKIDGEDSGYSAWRQEDIVALRTDFARDAALKKKMQAPQGKPGSSPQPSI